MWSVKGGLRIMKVFLSHIYKQIRPQGNHSNAKQIVSFLKNDHSKEVQSSLDTKACVHFLAYFCGPSLLPPGKGLASSSLGDIMSN